MGRSKLEKARVEFLTLESEEPPRTIRQRIKAAIKAKAERKRG